MKIFHAVQGQPAKRVLALNLNVKEVAAHYLLQPKQHEHISQVHSLAPVVNS